jgi:uncharacterized protein YbcC (UPF0753/DUF2309 family)
MTTTNAPTARNADTARIPPERLARIRALASQAADIVAPVWPLERFVAVNPLKGLEDRPFQAAVREGARLFGGRGFLPLTHYQASLAAGRIDRRALHAAFTAQMGDASRTCRVGDRSVDVTDALWTRLTNGPATASPIAAGTVSAARRAVERAGLRADDIKAPVAHDSWVDREVVRACAVFFDQGQASLAMPGRKSGLYSAWRNLAQADPVLRRQLDVAGRQTLDALPARADAAIDQALRALTPAGDGPGDRGMLEQHLAALPGWAGFIKQRHNEGDDPKAPADLVGYLAVRLSLARIAPRAAWTETNTEPGREAAVRRMAATARAAGLTPAVLDAADTSELDALWRAGASVTDDGLCEVYLAATEAGYRQALLAELAPRVPLPELDEQRPAAQLLFCIDVRSEVLRRHLEAQGTYRTAGYAGFFGLPIRYRPDPDTPGHAHCPVLLSPKHEIRDAPKPDRLEPAQAAVRQNSRWQRARGLFTTLKGNIAATYGLVEATGLAAGVGMATRTLIPRAMARLRDRLSAGTAVARHLWPRVSHTPATPKRDDTGMLLDEQVFYAQAMFALTGLGAPFGRLLVICGHGSTTTNNPYAAALDCGACGGRRGGPNARVLAGILNAPDVRTRLAERGIELPDDCVAVAAEHDTATDEVRLFDTDFVPDSHREDLAGLERDLAAAGRATRRERAGRLPDGTPGAPDSLTRRSADWAQVRPEWGLAGNAALIVGPRRWSQGLDLAGRCFLHDYDWSNDQHLEALTTILTAPMIVAQWINSQYYFSTVDNTVYGSGDKTTQNVVGGIGVMQGNESDLQIGLPRQSVHDDQGRPFHTPLRLLVIVLAPRERVGKVVAANTPVHRLLDNEWITLCAVEPENGRVHRYTPGGGWTPEDLVAVDTAAAA